MKEIHVQINKKIMLNVKNIIMTSTSIMEPQLIAPQDLIFTKKLEAFIYF